MKLGHGWVSYYTPYKVINLLTYTCLNISYIIFVKGVLDINQQCKPKKWTFISTNLISTKIRQTQWKGISIHLYTYMYFPPFGILQFCFYNIGYYIPPGTVYPIKYVCVFHWLFCLVIATGLVKCIRFGWAFWPKICFWLTKIDVTSSLLEQL